ncbi:MAG: N(6)-L-threonylcarbamoyladenine synthase, TsaB subunit [Sodalis sp. Ffu]|nr:MAG: N(6)-L-threonylcarbamoyladenine synthase, TsaB subunit [Sodalis sp. Ffu]
MFCLGMSTRILALDTSTDACSVALMIDHVIISERFAVAPREHMQRILPMVDSLLAEAGIALKNLDLLVFGRGPGSFTGVRIGIGIAQGLALGADLPLVGVSTLAALAQAAWRLTSARQVLTAIDARMGEVYWAQYRRQDDGIWLSDDSEALVAPAALGVITDDLEGNWAVAGNGWQTYPKLVCTNQLRLIPGETVLPAAQDMLPLALQQWRNDGACSVTQAAPTYLRNEVAWKPYLPKGFVK